MIAIRGNVIGFGSLNSASPTSCLNPSKSNASLQAQ
jgi:hypothetical protein